MYSYLLFSIANPAYFDEILSFVSSAERILPDNFGGMGRVQRFGDTFILMTWTSSELPDDIRQRINPGLVEHPTKGSIFTTNYFGEGVLSPTGGFFELIENPHEALRLADSLGGLGANV
jgi:hypothetical protein